MQFWVMVLGGLLVGLAFVGLTTTYTNAGVIPLLLGLALLLWAFPLPALYKQHGQHAALVLLGILLGLCLANLAVGATMFRSFDTRSAYEVVYQLKKDDPTATIALQPKAIQTMGQIINTQPLVPLGMTPGRTIVFCNNQGPWQTFHTDEYGFRNPAKVWQKETIDLTVVGDSFAMGYCSPDGQHFVDHLRKTFPNTLNLAVSANGPLEELATLKEYYVHKPGRILLWVYFEGNDLQSWVDGPFNSQDLQATLESKTPYANYLDPTFQQRLYERQTEVKAIYEVLLKEHHYRYHAQIDDLNRSMIPLRSLGWFAQVNNQWTLRFLKQWYEQWHLSQDMRPYFPTRLNKAKTMALMTPFNQVLYQAAQLSKPYGSRLVFVYLPAKEAFISTQPHPLYRQVVKTARQNGFEVVDLYENFKAQPHPITFYETDGVHLSAEGNAQVAQVLQQALK